MGLMSFVTNRDLFPGRWGFAIFVAYMALFINQGNSQRHTRTAR